MKKILILSMNNACRSQMAEGWFSYYGKGEVETFSAGFKPTFLDLHAAQSMMDAVIDITKYRSKSLNDVIDNRFDYVICLDNNIKDILPEFKNSPTILFYNFEDISSKNIDDEDKRKVYDDLRDELENLAFDFIHANIKALY